MKRLRSIILVAITIVAAATIALPASAATPGSSASLSITPKKNYVIEPGKDVKDKLTIRNLDQDAPLELSLRVVDFTFTDDGGTPKIFLEEDAPQTTWSLKPFLNVPKAVTIPAGGTRTFDISTAIPAGQGAGSYYSAIVYSSGAPGEGGNVGLSASGVTLVFVNVPGTVKENLKLENFGAYYEKNGGYKLFTQQDPQVIGYTLKNEGNVTEAPVGSIQITGLFGDKHEIARVNPTSSLALIGQTRTFQSCVKTKERAVNFNGTNTQASACEASGLWPGFYNLSLDVFYGQNGNPTKEVNGKSWFIYAPLWAIVALIVILLVAAWYIRKLVKNIRSGKLFGGRMKVSSRKRK